MVFNPDPTKQAQEVAFSKKNKKQKKNNNKKLFNKFVVEKFQTQKQLGFKLDKKLIF